MPDMNGWQLLFSGAGMAGVYAIARYVLPVLKTGWDSASTNNRAEKDMIERLLADIARLQADIAGYRERETGYIKMAAKMELIEYQLKQANDRIAALTTEIQLLKGAK